MIALYTNDKTLHLLVNIKLWVFRHLWCLAARPVAISKSTDSIINSIKLYNSSHDNFHFPAFLFSSRFPLSTKETAWIIVLFSLPKQSNYHFFTGNFVYRVNPFWFHGKFATNSLHPFFSSNFATIGKKEKKRCRLWRCRCVLLCLILFWRNTCWNCLH